MFHLRILSVSKGKKRLCRFRRDRSTLKRLTLSAFLAELSLRIFFSNYQTNVFFS